MQHDGTGAELLPEHLAWHQQARIVEESDRHGISVLFAVSMHMCMYLVGGLCVDRARRAAGLEAARRRTMARLMLAPLSR